MKKILLLVICGIYALVTQAQTMDTTAYNLNLEEVVVTGTRRAENVRSQQHQTSVLPTVMQQVPGVFVTSRSMMGYGVSTGAAGGINMRGITGGAGQLMVLIDGHPQYQGIYGHPISDSYQTMMAERVEVLRGSVWKCLEVRHQYSTAATPWAVSSISLPVVQHGTIVLLPNSRQGPAAMERYSRNYRTRYAAGTSLQPLLVSTTAPTTTGRAWDSSNMAALCS